MLTWLRRHSGAIVFALTLFVVALLLANAFKHNLVSAEWLKTQKDALSSVNSIATTVLLIGGAVFSYYRFFKGRILALRAEVSLSVSVHPTPTDTVLHSISLTAKNAGSATIWNPTPIVTLIAHGPEPIPDEVVQRWETPKVPGRTLNPLSVIEANETVSFLALRYIPKSVWAVTYMASVSADSGDVWFTSRTVTNSVKENGSK